MKDRFYDVLVYLYENYLAGDQFDDGGRGSVFADLTEAGFAEGQIRQALDWLTGLDDAERHIAELRQPSSQATRVFLPGEFQKLGRQGVGLIMMLESAGLYGARLREIIIERLMALDLPQLHEEQIRWVVMMVLTGHSDESQGEIGEFFLLENSASHRIH